MDITNSQAVQFCNEKARTIADHIEALDRTIDQFLLDVVRDFENNTSENQNSDKVIDRTSDDGRTLVTKANVAELKYVVEQIKACMDTDDRRQIVHKWVVNGRPLY